MGFRVYFACLRSCGGFDTRFGCPVGNAQVEVEFLVAVDSVGETVVEWIIRLTVDRDMSASDLRFNVSRAKEGMNKPFLALSEEAIHGKLRIPLRMIDGAARVVRFETECLTFCSDIVEGASGEVLRERLVGFRHVLVTPPVS